MLHTVSFSLSLTSTPQTPSTGGTIGTEAKEKSSKTCENEKEHGVSLSPNVSLT